MTKELVQYSWKLPSLFDMFKRIRVTYSPSNFQYNIDVLVRVVGLIADDVDFDTQTT